MPCPLQSEDQVGGQQPWAEHPYLTGLCTCPAPPQSPYLGCHVQEFVDGQLDAWGGLEEIYQAPCEQKQKLLTQDVPADSPQTGCLDGSVS